MKRIIFVVVFVAVVASVHGDVRKAHEAFSAGNEMLKDEDYSGAIAKYTEAIELVDFGKEYFYSNILVITKLEALL